MEKPLGHSLESSISINNEITRTFDENQIYRIDHYLGKETVQNLMVLRFANDLYENAWNSQNIENVQITVSESLGVETRANYYDKYGALLDMVQNHLRPTGPMVRRLLSKLSLTMKRVARITSCTGMPLQRRFCPKSQALRHGPVSVTGTWNQSTNTDHVQVSGASTGC